MCHCHVHGSLLRRLCSNEMDSPTNNAQQVHRRVFDDVIQEQIFHKKKTLPFVCFVIASIKPFFSPTIDSSFWAPLNIVFFNSVVFLLVMSHLKAVLSDPGTVPLPQSRLDFSDLHSNHKNGHEKEEWTVCSRCETYRPPRAHHCRICKRCIRRMDHHCPWINNCVGERNQKYFLQFLVYVCVLALYSIVLVLGSWIYPCADCNSDLAQSQARM